MNTSVAPSEVGERIEALQAAAKRGNDALAEAMAGASPRLWLAIDEGVRRRSWGFDRPAGTVLRACARGGHVREAAVDELTRLDDLLALPLLAIRAADWVPQVRERARRECLRRLFRDPLTALGLFPFACLLRGRFQGGWLAATLEATLRTPEVLTAALGSPDLLTRRTAYAVGRLGTGLLTDGLRDPDLKIRLTCANALADNADPAVLHQLRTSGTGTLRALAVRDHASAVAALTDRSSLVRAHAQLVVRRGGEDPASYYRELLPAFGAVAGLGETGAEADAPLLVPSLGDQRPKVRAEAVRGLRRLRTVPLTQLVPLLQDPSPRVARQAALSLLGCAELVDEATLVRLLAPGRPMHQRRVAHQLLCARDTWTRLAVDLRLALDPREPLRESALNDLGNWFRYDAVCTYTTPRGARAAELRDLADRAEPLLGAARVRQLRVHL